MGANLSLPGADRATSPSSLQASLLPPHQDHPASRRTSKSASSSSLTGSRTSQSSAASSSSDPEANGSRPPLEPKIQIVGLTRVGPDGALLLDRVSADVSRASITALIGPSGSGKSTVLRALNRLWEPNPGSVLLDGTDVTRLPVVQLRRRVGMLFQSAYLFDGTVADNVRYGPSLAGQQLTDGEVEALLDLVNLERSFADRPATSLSGGQAQRVALARALAGRPEVLLLDEPTSALDPAATIKIEESIRRLRDEQGVTVVWVSHSTEQVQRVADWVVLLVDGRVADSLAPADLHDGRHPLAEQFVAGKLESKKGPTLVEVEA